MVVHDFDIVRVRFVPDKTDSELVVNPNAVLSFAIALERFQTIPGWNSQLVELDNPVKNAEFFERCDANIGRNPFAFARLPQEPGIRICEASDQDQILTRTVANV